jgi:uncharacterized protein VirK/YbjX
MKPHQSELKFIWIKIILKVDLLNFSKTLNDEFNFNSISIHHALNFLLNFNFLQHNFLVNQL